MSTQAQRGLNRSFIVTRDDKSRPDVSQSARTPPKRRQRVICVSFWDVGNPHVETRDPHATCIFNTVRPGCHDDKQMFIHLGRAVVILEDDKKQE